MWIAKHLRTTFGDIPHLCLRPAEVFWFRMFFASLSPVTSSCLLHSKLQCSFSWHLSIQDHPSQSRRRLHLLGPGHRHCHCTSTKSPVRQIKTTHLGPWTTCAKRWQCQKNCKRLWVAKIPLSVLVFFTRVLPPKHFNVHWFRTVLNALLSYSAKGCTPRMPTFHSVHHPDVLCKHPECLPQAKLLRLFDRPLHKSLGDRMHSYIYMAD